MADLKENNILPDSPLADTLCGSDENVQAAADMGVELVAPMPGMEPLSADTPAECTSRRDIRSKADDEADDRRLRGG